MGSLEDVPLLAVHTLCWPEVTAQMSSVSWDGSGEEGSMVCSVPDIWIFRKHLGGWIFQVSAWHLISQTLSLPPVPRLPNTPSPSPPPSWRVRNIHSFQFPSVSPLPEIWWAYDIMAGCWAMKWMPQRNPTYQMASEISPPPAVVTGLKSGECELCLKNKKINLSLALY